MPQFPQSRPPDRNRHNRVVKSLTRPRAASAGRIEDFAHPTPSQEAAHSKRSSPTARRYRIEDFVHVQHLCDRARSKTDRFIPERAASRRRAVSRGGQGGVAVRRIEGQDVREGTQICVWLGFATLSGYLPIGRGLAVAAHVSSQYRRPHEKATTGDLQSGAGASSHRKRSNGGAAQLPVVQWFDRTFSGSTSAAAAFSCDADMYGVWSSCSLHSGSSVVGIRVGARSQALAHSVVHECASFFVRD